MGRVFRPCYTKSDGKGGRVRVQVRDWHAEFRDEHGKKQRVRVGPDKRLAESALARLQEQATRRKFGLPDPTAEAATRARPLKELFAEYRKELTHRKRAENYRAEVFRQLDAIVAGCKWRSWADVTEFSLLKFLADIQVGRTSVSPATANGSPPDGNGVAGSATLPSLR
jgi:hypothetical protein